MGQGDREAGQSRAQQFAQSELMRGVGDRPQQTHPDRLDAGLGDGLDGLGCRALVERDDHVARGADALGHLEGQRPGNVRLGVGN